MIIGISGTLDSNKSDVSKFISERYNFVYIDCDKILEQILKTEQIRDEIRKVGWQTNNLLLFRIRNEVDFQLIKKIDEIGKNKDILIDYSLLEDSFIFEKCDVLIKLSNSKTVKSENNLDVLKNSRVSNFSNDSRYHLKVNTSVEWQEKLFEYIEYNVLAIKKVSVIVPIYNTSKYLVRCINSIRNQTYRNLEIILIDDGSTDDSLELCKLLAGEDERIKIIHQRNVIS